MVLDSSNPAISNSLKSDWNIHNLPIKDPLEDVGSPDGESIYIEHRLMSVISSSYVPKF